MKKAGRAWMGIWTIRAAAALAWLMVWVAVLPGQGPIVTSASVRESPTAGAPSVLMLSDQARRFLVLQYQSSRVEFMGCMIGEVRGPAIWVERIAPADVAPSQATPTWVVPTQTCEQAGWAGTVGLIHSHLGTDRCWYYFPNTQVPTSDARSFLHNPYPVDAIMCGTRVVWIGRDLMQQQVTLTEDRDGNPVRPTAP